MKRILLFGAGKSATILIEYLLQHAHEEIWQLIIVDKDLQLAQNKIGKNPYGLAVSFDTNDASLRKKYISESNLVISMLPPDLHALVASDCLEFKKHLITASYVDPAIRAMHEEVKNAGILFLCEMGLDPGIDHMSAMQIIHDIQAKGGRVTSFKSHCGGLVAPESDDNPWHYKISWNPRNIVLAGKAGARYRENGEEINLPYEQLFSSEKMIETPETGFLCWYPNRDSLSYPSLYGVENAETFLRTTLRHPDFIYGWKNIIDLKLTDETPVYETDNKTLMDVFREHMNKAGFSDWLQKKLMERFTQTRELLDNMMKLLEAEEQAMEQGEEIPDNLMMVDDNGELENVPMEEIKNTAAGVMAHKMHEANLTLKQLFFLGMDDDKTFINRGLCSASDFLQFALEKKLALQPHDRDMIVMIHEIGYELDGKKEEIVSTLVVKGENANKTAMAKTVGLPMGIAAKLILDKKLTLSGVHIPTLPEIYQPVLDELADHGIRFTETIKE